MEISFAVVGSSGCGKSTFVRKSLKRHDLTDTELRVARSKEGSHTRLINCTHSHSPLYSPDRYSLSRADTCRKANIKLPGATDFKLSMFELSTEQLEAEDGGIRNGSAWPVGLPHVDGIFVCYNAADLNSFKHLGELLSLYSVAWSLSGSDIWFWKVAITH